MYTRRGNDGGKLRAPLLCLSMCFLCFGLIGLVCMTDQPSNQPCLIGQACLHDEPTALARWVKTRSVIYSLLVCRVDGREEVVHMNRMGTGARVPLVRFISSAQASLALVGHLHQVMT